MTDDHVRSSCVIRLQDIFGAGVVVNELGDEWCFEARGESSYFGFWPVGDIPDAEEEAFFRDVVKSSQMLLTHALEHLQTCGAPRVDPDSCSFIFRPNRALELQFNTAAEVANDAVIIVSFESGQAVEYEVVEDLENCPWWDDGSGSWQA